MLGEKAKTADVDIKTNCIRGYLFKIATGYLKVCDML